MTVLLTSLSLSHVHVCVCIYLYVCMCVCVSHDRRTRTTWSYERLAEECYELADEHSHTLKLPPLFFPKISDLVLWVCIYIHVCTCVCLCVCVRCHLLSHTKTCTHP